MSISKFMHIKLPLILTNFIVLPLYSENLENQFAKACNLNKSGQIEDASKLFNQITRQYPDCTQAFYNYAHTLKDLGNMHEAIDTYNKVIEREPHNTFAHFAMSHCYLSLLDYQHGWPKFEFRSKDIQNFDSDIAQLKHAVECNQLIKKHILLRAEWGLGDCIQFVRFAAQLKKYGATVIVQAHKQLQKLFSLCPYIDKVIAVGDSFPHHELQIPLLSLPYIFSVSADNLKKINDPYLYANPSLISLWQKKISQDSNFKIGICWNGNGDQHAPPLLNKNIPLEMFSSLISMPGISVYSLQKLDSQNILEISLATKLITYYDFDESHGRFMDTAALMQCMNLIITVDTSIAHLAGAMHLPTWILLPYRSDWRWGLQGTTTPWYPTIQLFRQPKPGDWASIIDEIKVKLASLNKKNKK